MFLLGSFSVCLCVCWFACLFVFLIVCGFVGLSVCMCVRLFLCSVDSLCLCGWLFASLVWLLIRLFGWFGRFVHVSFDCLFACVFA